MKRILALLLALVMLLALTACGAEEIQQAADIIAEVAEAVQEATDDSTSTASGPEEASAPESQPAEEASETEEAGETAQEAVEPEEAAATEEASLPAVEEDGRYYDVEHVVTYLMTYGKLPSNYITKKQAENLGWQGGSVQKYQEGAAIGGNRFGNYEGLLPTDGGVTYTECDIDTDGASSRGAKRVIFSSDGHYYYTEDHYESFREVTFENGEWVYSDVN